LRLLLDTHIFLWIVESKPRLGRRGMRLVRAASEVFVSSATIWEVAIKASVGKLRVNPEDLIEEIDAGGFQHLPVLAKHAARVAQLPLLHRDPFDRMLVAQAISESMQLLTADAHLTHYSELVVQI
jgi:PIN domain nuclease of toxin-antitoxin system